MQTPGRSPTPGWSPTPTRSPSGSANAPRFNVVESPAAFPKPILEPNRQGNPALGAVGPFEGIVAAQAWTAQNWASTSVITTPNARWIPEQAVAHSEITTHTDGRWGRHEYSRWPQRFARDAFHTHCIPVNPRPQGPREILWRTLSPQDWKVDNCGIVGVGFLDRALEFELAEEALETIRRYQRCDCNNDGWKKIGHVLVVCLLHVIDRMRTIPALPGIVIALAAHVQRLSLELSGMIEWINVVEERVRTKRNCRQDVLDVLGAHTPDPSVAQMLHDAGIPVWFQQQLSTRTVMYEVVVARDIPSEFSLVPSYPRLVLAKRDLSGALNMAGEWQRAMAAVVRRQLCESRLPGLLEAEREGPVPPAKRLRDGAIFLDEGSSYLGGPKPVFITQNSREARSLKHDLPSVPAPARAAQKVSRRTRARHAKKDAAADSVVASGSGQGKGFAMIPSRQFYRSRMVTVPAVWTSALSALSPVAQPHASVKYFFAPPWLLDSLDGFDFNPEKTARYVHHWAAIRTFCRNRLLDSTVAGRPLAISEWRDALWGDYEIDAPKESADGRAKIRHELQQSIRRLFGNGASLPTYRVDSQPQFGSIVVTHEVATSDSRLYRCIVWEAHEINWRCELLALDALLTGSNEWSELFRWMREWLVSQVWGSGSSGLDITPPLDESRSPVFCWLAPPEEGWEHCRTYLRAFVEILNRWPGCPAELRGAHLRVMECGPEYYGCILRAACVYYVRTFVEKYERLPVPPVHFPSEV